VVSIGQDAQFGTGQGGGPGDARDEVGPQLSPERPGLADQGAEVGPAVEHVIDFLHERPGPGYVGQREVHAGELDPGLDGQVGYGTGQPGPQPLGADELPARFGDIFAGAWL